MQLLDVHLLNYLQGTFAEAGDGFDPCPKEPVDSSEKVIGELTPLLKALYIARERHYARWCKAARRLQKGIPITLHELQQFERDFDTLDSLFWGEVERTFRRSAADLDIREGYRVVEIATGTIKGLRLILPVLP